MSSFAMKNTVKMGQKLYCARGHEQLLMGIILNDKGQEQILYKQIPMIDFANLSR